MGNKQVNVTWNYPVVPNVDLGLNSKEDFVSNDEKAFFKLFAFDTSLFLGDLRKELNSSKAINHRWTFWDPFSTAWAIAHTLLLGRSCLHLSSSNWATVLVTKFLPDLSSCRISFIWMQVFPSKKSLMTQFRVACLDPPIVLDCFQVICNSLQIFSHHGAVLAGDLNFWKNLLLQWFKWYTKSALELINQPLNDHDLSRKA